MDDDRVRFFAFAALATMVASTSGQPLRNIAQSLRGLGYEHELLRENYAFLDWFSPKTNVVEVALAAFGDTPVSQDTACIGVVQSNGLSGSALIDRCRALGAPVVLEVDRNEIREWAVSRKAGEHHLHGKCTPDAFTDLVAARAHEWTPTSLLRAKNIGSFRLVQQLGLFTGLLPELEEHIQASLEPMLRSAFSATKDAYRSSTGREPDPAKLFKLVFWLLTAKVFADRQIGKFANLRTTPDADELLDLVATQYDTTVPLLLNRESREVAVSQIWGGLDFRNLSADVLSHIWATALLDTATKKRLGIHRTSRTIVRYIIDRIGLDTDADTRLVHTGNEQRIIVEPCCGSAVFLIGAMHALKRHLLLMTPKDRHAYYVRHLRGLETDVFGVEISRLALTLADFPNPDGWDIVATDVFEPGALAPHVQHAAVVLCNPPFGEFSRKERNEYDVRSHKKPAEIINRILDDLHPRGVLGFVLPRTFLDGRSYKQIRERLTERFAALELTTLPDSAFDADVETTLLIATQPIPHRKCRVVSRKVRDTASAWSAFELSHEVSSESVQEMDPAQAGESLDLPELPDVWDFLSNYPQLQEVADVHRGIEWSLPLTKKGKETGNRSKLVRRDRADGFRQGVPPLAGFDVFTAPSLAYLDMRKEHQRGGAHDLPWNKPKVIMNKSARRRGPWRLSAFPDSSGLVCYQTCHAIWPKSEQYDEWLLAAVLNSPVANAFAATREGKTDVKVDTTRRIPVPQFNDFQAEQLRSLVKKYQSLINTPLVPADQASRLLMEIDAVVLDGYRMPPRLEHKLLDYFKDSTDRPTAHAFGAYLGLGDDVYFSLSDRLSPRFKEASAVDLLKRISEDEE